jgi:hypothetical protein
MIKTTPDGSKKIYVPSDAIMSIAYSPVEVIIAAPSTGLVEVADQVVLRVATATIRDDLQIFAATNYRAGGIRYTSEDEAKATVDAYGYVTTTGTGYVGIRIKSKFVTQRITHVAEAPRVDIADTFDHYLEDTLGEILNNEIDAAIVASVDKNVYSLVDHATPAYTRNPNCWITADKTSWPAWNSWAGNQIASGCAITPLHTLHATHATPIVGSTLRFVTNTNTIVTRTIDSLVYSGQPDLTIAELDSPLPGTITPAKVLPTDWGDYLSIGSCPLVVGNQSMHLLLREWHSYTSDPNWFVAGEPIKHRASAANNRLPVTHYITFGDSGSPLYVMIDDELVALGCHWSANGCSFISQYMTEINSAISGSGYSLTPIDLSSYPNYG